MKFKEFVSWCSERAADGCWGLIEALACIDLIKTVKEQPFWKRERFWKQEYEQRVLDEIVNPINRKMVEARKKELINDGYCTHRTANTSGNRRI